MAAARAEELVAEIKATLTAERNGVTLGLGLVDTMVQYFVEVVLPQRHAARSTSTST